jgi:mono/diheme cytochrome c family protein
MKRWVTACCAATVAIAATGCLGRHAPSGFRLPPGDAVAGKAAFVELKCNSCHRVAGVDLPAPTAKTVVALGGRKLLPPTDGDLTTDIILPSSHFALGYAAADVQEGARSKMPDYTRLMTIRQLADLVAFLQQHYGATGAAAGAE